MAKPRPQKTLADYVAIAISPVLIMLLVGSLVFFLAEATYSGSHGGQLRWILFWFVLASVLVARIGIEQGRGYAAGYGLALGAATSLVLIRFIDSYAIGAICLLGVTWWCTDKLTWDCTLIDDDADSSGEGLLKSAKLDTETKSESDAEQSPESKQPEESPADTTAETPGWWNGFGGKPADDKPHAPGKWVVYFSLAALPLFGVGQLLIPAEKSASRDFAFQLLCVYVASALALLVTTSFLGLRRYLRQRRLKMPANVTATWLGMGGGLILVIMLLCILLPRPNASYSMTQLIDKVSNKAQKASKNAMMKGDAAEGDGKRIGKTPEGKSVDPGKSGGGKTGKEDKGDGGGKSKPGGKQGKGKAKKGSGEKKGKNKGGKQAKGKTGRNNDKAKDGGNKKNDKTDGQKSGEQKSDDPDRKNGKGDPDDRDEGNQEQPDTQSKTSKTAEWIGKFVKWLIYGIIAVVVFVFVLKNWQSFLTGIGRFFADLRNLFGWFKPKHKLAADGTTSENGEAAKPAPRPFSSFANPFHTGTAHQTAPKTVVVDTFEAFEAWAYEHGIERRPEQTPTEFADEVAMRTEGISQEAAKLARLYTRAAYAQGNPSAKCLDILELIWDRMSANSAYGRRTETMTVH